MESKQAIDELSQHVTNPKKIFRNSIADSIVIIITASITQWVLKLLYRGFDFTKPTIMLVLAVIPFVFFSNIYRAVVFPREDPHYRRNYFISFLISLNFSFLFFELGLYFFYCDGIFLEVKNRFC
ncbi:MAG: hypothetical protein ACXAB7_05275 [Candidatus Kariarchaeaceae archaeon]|jgi:hypothetical protein